MRRLAFGLLFILVTLFCTQVLAAPNADELKAKEKALMGSLDFRNKTLKPLFNCFVDNQKYLQYLKVEDWNSGDKWTQNMAYCKAKYQETIADESGVQIKAAINKILQDAVDVGHAYMNALRDYQKALQENDEDSKSRLNKEMTTIKAKLYQQTQEYVTLTQQMKAWTDGVKNELTETQKTLMKTK